MIDNYQAFSANERTYLAWVRTAIAIVGIGLIVRGFDPTTPDRMDEIIGYILVGSGALLILFAALRFRAVNARIGSAKSEGAFKARFGIVFVMMNVMLCILLASFLLHIT